MEKQIEEIERALNDLEAEYSEIFKEWFYDNKGQKIDREFLFFAKGLYDAGYRKIYDDHQRQCTCYARGCQMAESLKTEVAEEIFAEIENALGLLRKAVAEGRKNDGIKYQQLHDGRIISLEAIAYFTAELKKKYTEGE